MTQPDTFNDFSTALRMREVIAKLVREEMNRQRPAPRYGKVYSFNRFNATAQVLFPGDTTPIRVKVPQSVQPTRRVEVDGDLLADVVKVEGTPGNLWVTEVLSGPTFQYASQLNSPVLMGGEFLHQQVAKFFAPGVSQLPSIGSSWFFGRWINTSSFASDGLAYVEVVVQQTLFAQIIKKYNFSIRTSDTVDVWKKCVPTFDSGPWSNENFNLEVRTGADYIEFRVRRVAGTTSGFTPGGYDFSVWFYGQDWQQDSGSPAGIDGGVEPTRVHGTDSTEGKGPLLAPGMYVATLNQFLLTGGGAVQYKSGNLTWTERFLLIGSGRHPMVTQGYLQIPVPVGGVSIPVYGAAATSVNTVAGGVPLSNYQALYYDPPWGAGSADYDEGRFRIVDQGSSNSLQGVPSHWILVAVQTNDAQSKCVRLGTGVTIPVKFAASLQAPWVAYGSGYYTPAYTRVGNRVYLEGLLKNSSASASVAGDVAFNLPAGFRPGARTIYVNAATNTQSFARIDVQSTGDVSIQTVVNAAGFVALDGISFGAEL